MKNNKQINKAIIIVIILILIMGGILWLQNNKHNKNSNKTSNMTNNSYHTNPITSEQESNINSNKLSNYNSNATSNVLNSNHNTSNNYNSLSNNNKQSNSNYTTSNHITSNSNSNKVSNNNNSSNSSNIIGLKTNGTFSGIFQKDKMKIIVYQHKLSKIHFRIINTSNGRQYISKADITNKKAIGTINYNYTFTLTDTGIQLSTTDPNKEISGNYIKTNTYSTNDYYSDYIGELKYENSNYNGIFNGEKGTIKLYQANNKDVVIKMIINNKTYNQTLTIKNDKLVHGDINGKITISISGNNLIVESS